MVCVLVRFQIIILRYFSQNIWESNDACITLSQTYILYLPKETFANFFQGFVDTNPVEGASSFQPNLLLVLTETQRE